jgi:tetratricopeptide (TPR) repeat protein
MIFGRERELSAIDRALVAARGGARSLLLFTGEAGIGKSALTREAAAQAEQAGMRVASGRCWEAGGAVPYWPWVQIFRALGSDPFQELSVETQHFAEQRFRFFDAATQRLLSAARDAPLTVILDDLHAADLASLHFLLFVARNLIEAPLVLIGTARSPEARSVQAVHEALMTVAREGKHLAIARLSREAVDTWLSGYPTGVVEAVYRESEGNPLFVEELLRVGGNASHNSGITFTLDRHLRLVPEEVRKILANAAVFGRQFAVREVARLSDLGEHQVRDALRVAHNACIVEPLETERFQFAHVLLRDRLYETLPNRDALAWKAGVIVEEEGGPPSQIVHHLLDGNSAGDVEHLAQATLRAVAEAEQRLAFESAAALAERTLTRMGGTPTRLGCALEIAGGEALIRAGAVEAGRAHCLRAAASARALADSEAMARAALAYAAEPSAVAIDQTMVGFLEEALSMLKDIDHPQGARVRARLALALVPPRESIERQRVLDLARSAIAMARRLDDDDTLLVTLLYARGALMPLAHADETFALAEEIVALARARKEWNTFLVVAPKSAVSLLERGRRAEANAQLAQVLALAERFPVPLTAWRTTMLRAAFALFDGQLEEARVLGDEALALADASGTRQADLIWAQQRIALAALEQRPSSILDVADKLLAILGHNPLFAPQRAHVLAATGRFDEARTELDTIADTFPVYAFMFGAEACIVLEERDRAPRLYELLRANDPGTYFFWGGLATGLALGPAPRLLGELARLSGRFDEAREHFGDAIRLCRNIHNAPFLELTLAGLARLDSEQALHQREVRLDGNDVPLDREAERYVAGLAPSALPQPFHLVLEREGEMWVVEGPAHRRFRIKHSKGLAYLSVLVESPRREFHVLTLIGVAHRTGDAGPMLDARARSEYRARVEALREALDEAESFGDLDRAGRARAELETLSGELAAAVGLFGRDRRAASDVQRARVNVQRRLKDAIDAIGQFDPQLARYLRASISSGVVCSFTPI